MLPFFSKEMKLTNITAILHLFFLSLIVFFLYEESLWGRILALSFLLFSLYLDFLDRALLQKKNDVSSFLHPIMDKLVIFVILFVFMLHGSFSWIIFVFFVIRDLVAGMIRMRASRDFVFIKAANLYGKAITSLQFFLVFFLLTENVAMFGHKQALLFKMIVASVTVFTSIVAFLSIFHYSISYAHEIRKKKEEGTEIQEERMVIFANKKSGGYKNVYRRRLLRRFARRRKAILYYFSDDPNLFKGIKGKVKDFDNVIIAGGDGTFESALNNKTLQEKSLGFFPLGAGNSYYSYFYKGKRFEYLRSRFPFRELSLDILEVEWDKGKKLTGFLSIGIDAEVMKQVMKRRNHTFADYCAGGVATAFGPSINYNLQGVVDGTKYVWENCFNLIIAKVPYIGYGLRSLLGHLEPNDGLILGMASVNTHSSIFNKVLRLWQIFLTQLGLAKSPLFPLKGKVFEVRSTQPIALQAGGEFLGYTKWLRVQVKRKQRVLMI